MCSPENTGNQLFASETRSIGQEASTNRNFSFPGEFPQRDLLPMLTVFGERDGRVVAGSEGLRAGTWLSG